MFTYYIYCGALQGSALYDTEEEALRAAAFRSAIDGRCWEVRLIYCPEP